MAWTTPKTDWKITYVDGEYAGDYCNYTDYNRIKGNIEYLAALPTPRVFIDDMGGDKVVGNPIYSSEFNAFQNNLEKIHCKLLPYLLLQCNLLHHYPLADVSHRYYM